MEVRRFRLVTYSERVIDLLEDDLLVLNVIDVLALNDLMLLH